MNEIEIIDLLGKLQDLRDDIYILGNFKTAKTNLENIIEELNLKINKIKVNGVDTSQDQALNLACVNHRFLTMKNAHAWGISMLYMEEGGKAFARTYWYFDDESTIYFDWLNVIETARGNGIATELLNIHLKTADEMKIESCLSVKKGTWMHEWYKRKGYKDLKDNEIESNTIWMNRLPQNGG